MFENLKLRNRILLGYSAPIGLALIVAGAVFVGVGNVARLAASVQEANNTLKDAADLAWNLSDIQKTGRGYLIQRSDTSRTRYSKTVEDLKKLSESLQQDVKDPALKKQLDDLLKIKEELIAYYDQLLALVDAGNVNGAIAAYRAGDARKLSGQLEEVGNNFVAKAEDVVKERQVVRAAALSSLSLLVAIGALLSAAVSIALGYLISNAIAKQVRDSANLVASASSEIAATVEQQERTIVQQSASVNETTTTVEELGASSRQSAEQADTSAAGAREALAVTGDGLKAVEQTTEGLNNLKDKVRAIAEQIMRLSEQTGQISGVTAVVADIANQTNMLALNAAVEAARAGEQGKGFAVVASEIRKLADESKKSAERIYQLVSDVQAAMNSTVMVTDEGTKTADASIRLAQGTADAFNTVSEAINSVFLNNQQIALGSKQQAVGVQQVVSAMNAINLGSKETASGISQVKASANNLSAVAKNLQALV